MPSLIKASRMRASLIPLDNGQPIEIVKDVTVVGRKEFCDVRLDDPSVSKVHLLIVRTDGLLLFRDMGSTNGTKVNGQRVIRGALLPNDKLSIAACRYQVQFLPDEPNTDKEISDHETPNVGQPAMVQVFRAQELVQQPPHLEKLPHQESPDDDGRLATDQEAQGGNPSAGDPA